MTPRTQFWLWLPLIISSVGLIFWGGSFWLADDGHTPYQRSTIQSFLVLGSFTIGVLFASVWMALDIMLFVPLRMLVRSIEITLHTVSTHELQTPSQFRLLVDLAAVVRTLSDQLHSAQREVAEALSSGAARVEAEKLRLETVLRDLDNGVIVCDIHGRLVLYNPAAVHILSNPPQLGLGRIIYQLFTPQAIEHRLEMLRRRQDDQSIGEFVCATGDGAILLHCRLARSLEMSLETGFVLAFTDITQRVESLRQQDQQLRRLIEDFRAPIANLRAAAENLLAYPEMDGDTQKAFYKVVAQESSHLSGQLEKVAQEPRVVNGSRWSMTDVYSTDLINCLIGKLSQFLIIDRGLSLWLHVDSYALLVLLEYLLKNIHAYAGVQTFALETTPGNHRVYLDIIWQGKSIPAAELAAWNNNELQEAVGTTTVHDIIEIHDSDLWSQCYHDDSYVLLRLPLPKSRRQGEQPTAPSSRRLTHYDFELPGLPADLGKIADYPLSSLEFVVFDTETTGLRPSEGDEIISIAAVRVVNGRILEGETFQCLVNPRRHIPIDSVRFHGIVDEMVRDAPFIDVVLPQFKAFVGDAVLVGHNVAFDMKFLYFKEKSSGIRFNNPTLDTLILSAYLHDHIEAHDLDSIARRLGVEIVGRHTAVGDTLATAEVFLRLIDLLAAKGVETLDQAIAASETMVA
ncbi:MAG: hypothetical protein BWK79_16825, partial [Beggiatoa sp. IS2]